MPSAADLQAPRPLGTEGDVTGEGGVISWQDQYATEEVEARIDAVLP